eukprot:TRINITY_DN975_c0_g1_i1.p1 TRINITY_DN975_c0_g1~~TRINITY_DN975_c0_g1_i1.p1  ORF type:complete len:306 (-),score=94.50 TRINITY_DN975_c0_g1_i1:32-868(-)
MSESIFKDDILKGKVALVTGGATGINYGVAELLGRHGAKLAIMGRRKEVVEKAVSEFASMKIEAIGVPGDVRSYETCEKAVEAVIAKYGRLDILINGAAGNFLVNAENLSSNGFKTVIEIDLQGTFNMSRASFKELKKTKGNIINISATLHYHTTPWQAHASAAKAGVDSLTQSLAHEWGDFGIRVNAVAPGPIKATEGMTKLSLGISPEELDAKVSEAVPLHRTGTAQDIANATLFLVSPAASYITGDILVVDGGACLWSPRNISREALEAMRRSKL